MVAKILMVDDESISLLHLKKELKSVGTVITANSVRQALDLSRTKEFALIFIDIMLPDANGIELAKMIKDDKKNRFAPIIFFSADTRDKTIEKAYAIGGIDFLSKPVNSKVLKAKASLFVDMYLRRKKMKQALLKLSNTDDLTGIFNRRKFNDLTEFEVGVVKRYKRPLTLILFDIDDFKKVNDTFGHPEGDKVLKELTKLIMKHKRETDILARYGGEEFALLCPETPVDDYNAWTIGDRLRRIVEEHTFSSEYRITISLGATEFRRTCDNYDSFIHRVDKALYKAKRNGKNRIEIIK